MYIEPKDIVYQLSNLQQLTFEVTDACNLKCKYCGYGEFYEDYDQRENINLPVEYAIRLIDYLTTFWNSNQNASANRNVYISFYGGEPLLNMPFIEKVVDYVENKIDCPTRNFTFSMTTNAMLLDRYMDFLVKHNFSLLISLDGNAENTAYRVDHNNKPVFERIINNVNKLKNKYPEYFEDRVNFNAVLHNKNSVEDIYRFFKEQYNKIASIGELNNMGIRPDKQELFNQTYRNSFESLHQSEHYQEIEKDMFMRSASYQSVCLFIHQYSGFVYRDYTDLLFEKNENKRTPTGTCLPFSKKMFVTVNGKILPCERIGHQFALGEVNNTEIKLDFDAIAEKYNAYYAKLDKQCSKCKNTIGCSQCIFNLDNLENKPVCYGFMTESDFRNYEMSQLAFIAQNPEDYYRIMEDIIVE